MTLHVMAVLAASTGDNQLFLGKDLLPWLLVAFGGAMVVGNLAAYFKPPKPDPRSGRIVSPDRPPLGRTLGFVGIGAIAAVWALASIFR